MAKTFAQAFYNSKAWKQCRAEYKKQRHYLCERCLAKGVMTPGEIVHHKVRITPTTVDDPSITLNFDNLELLCRECHEAEHKNEKHKPKTHDRYYIDDDGKIIITEE